MSMDDDDEKAHRALVQILLAKITERPDFVLGRLVENDKTGAVLKAALEKRGLVASTGKLTDTSTGRRLLRLACSSGNTGSAKVLLELGASPLGIRAFFQKLGCVHPEPVETRPGRTSCVIISATQDDAEMMDLLLSTSGFGDLANIPHRHTPTDERSPLMHVASRYRHICRGVTGRAVTLFFFSFSLLHEEFFYPPPPKKNEKILCSKTYSIEVMTLSSPHRPPPHPPEQTTHTHTHTHTHSHTPPPHTHTHTHAHPPPPTHTHTYTEREEMYSNR